MENLSEIKLGFIDYLKDKYGDSQSKEIDVSSPELSIFMYSSDFQTYLVDNGYADVSVFSQSISEIKDMLSSGETQNSDETNSDSFMLNALTDVFNQDEDLFSAINTNENDTIDMDEITSFLDSVDEAMQIEPENFENTFDGIAKTIQNMKGIEAEKTPEEILENIYASEEALEYLDLDGDGEISDIEKELFESYVQGDKEELTSEDLEKAFEDIKNGEFKYDIKLPENAKPVEDIPETAASESSPSSGNVAARQTSNPSAGMSPTGRTYSGGAPVSGASNSIQTPSNTKDMTLQQLKTEQGKRQSNVDNAKQTVDTTLSDIDDVKSNEYPEVKEAYDKAVENDENIDEELKEKRAENLDAIESTGNEIDSLNSQISETEVSLGEANDKLDGDKKNLDALKSALSSYDGAKSDDAAEQAQIDAKKAELQEQINNLEQNTIPDDEEKCKELEEKSTELKEQLKEKEEDLKTLEEERTEIENEIAEKGSEETKQALKDFQAVEKKLDDLRAKLPDAQQALATAQEELTQINEEIRTKEAEEVKSKNSYTNSSLPAELVSALDGKLGSGFTAKLEQVAKNLNCDPADLLGMMQSESGLNPQAYNKNGGATGLIQFMPSTARSLGTSTEELLNMSAIDQLDYVEKYFSNWTGGSGQKLSGGDLYTLCFLPAYLNKEVLCTSGDSYYAANSGLDANGDGQITKSELGNRVQNKYQELLRSLGIA